MSSDQLGERSPESDGPVADFLARVEETLTATNSLVVAADGSLTGAQRTLGTILAVMDSMRQYNERAANAVLRPSYRYTLALMVGSGLIAALAFWAYILRPDAVALDALIYAISFIALNGVVGLIIDEDVRRTQVRLLMQFPKPILHPEVFATTEEDGK